MNVPNYTICYTKCFMKFGGIQDIFRKWIHVCGRDGSAMVGSGVASSADAPVARGVREEIENQLLEAEKPEELSNLLQRSDVRAAMDAASASAAWAEEMAIGPRKGRGLRVQDDDGEYEKSTGAGSGSTGGKCRPDKWCHRLCRAVYSSLGHAECVECELRCERRWSYRGGMEDVMGGYRKHGTY